MIGADPSTEASWTGSLKPSRQILKSSPRAGQKLPMGIVGLIAFGICTQRRNRVTLRVDADADESDAFPIGPPSRISIWM